MAGGRLCQQTAIIWNGLQERFAAHPPFSVLAFTSTDSYDWRYSSTIAN